MNTLILYLTVSTVQVLTASKYTVHYFLRTNETSAVIKSFLMKVSESKRHSQTAPKTLCIQNLIYCLTTY